MGEMTVMRACMGIAAVLGSFMVPQQTHACGGSACARGAVYPPAGQVPTNALELVWRPPRMAGADAGALRAPRLFRADGDGGTGQALAVTVGAPAANGEVRISPTRPVAAGTRLVIERDEGCGGGSIVRSTLEVGESAAKPTALGRLHVTTGRRPVSVPVYSGGCTDRLDASYADLTLELTEAARPYADLFRYEVRADDDPKDVSYGDLVETWGANPYAIFEPLARGSELLFALCESGFAYPSGVTPGVHRVRMVGRLPDGTELSSDEVSVDLHCDVRPVDAGTGSDARDGGRADAAVSVTVPRGIDSGLSPSPRAAASPADAGRADTDTRDVALGNDLDIARGCALAPARGASSRAALWLVATLLFVLGRRGNARRARNLGSSCV